MKTSIILKGVAGGFLFATSAFPLPSRNKTSLGESSIIKKIGVEERASANDAFATHSLFDIDLAEMTLPQFSSCPEGLSEYQIVMALYSSYR